ncbi:LOW QUALITY PROTEIN: hypothetical protein Cgig2_005764 [Carnegiea gigantea]|uniref:Uncharacterized protein n=1 Tax=Carnegiea gigantea TaxID=171969 RepID=A0A9Q1GV69_9CARY|nr:LOW QUALITY PROTEIN: hypothetical protein Cgig2_005764 [Carnegiea gigantea]
MLPLLSPDGDNSEDDDEDTNEEVEYIMHIESSNAWTTFQNTFAQTMLNNWMDSQSQGENKMDISQGSQSGREKNEHFWTRDEENGLLFMLSANPLWKAKGNFKGWVLVKLESMLNEKFPSRGLKAYPHIDLKIKDKDNVIIEMLRTSRFSWDDTTKMMKCERQSYEYFCKVFGPNRATRAASDNFEEAVNDLQNETIEMDKDEENDDDEEEDEFARKEPTSKGKGKTKASQCEIVDLTLSFNIVSSNLIGFINDINSHLLNIACALGTTQQHEKALKNREMKLDD